MSSSSSSSSAYPAIAVGFIILGEIFAYATVFNPTIEVVTFRLMSNVKSFCHEKQPVG